MKKCIEWCIKNCINPCKKNKARIEISRIRLHPNKPGGRRKNILKIEQVLYEILFRATCTLADIYMNR